MINKFFGFKINFSEKNKMAKPLILNEEDQKTQKLK